MYNFNTLSLVFLISNIIAMPLFAVIVSLGFVNIFISFVSINLAKLAAVILNLFLKALMSVADFTSKLPFANIIIKTPHLLTIIFYYLVILCIVGIHIWKRAQICVSAQNTN